MNSDDEDDIMQPERLPIYRKGKEIFDMVSKITALIPENDEYLMDIKACMLCDAAQLTVKVVGGEAAELYDLKMENAAIIRKAARDLMVQQHSLNMFGFEEDPEE
jgi:deoxyribose-phosphate aldolase